MYYNFFIKIYPDGTRIPSIDVPWGKYQFISELAGERFIRSDEVVKVLLEIDKVLDGSVLEYSFADSDNCIVEVQQQRSRFINGFDEFEPYELSTNELLVFLNGWKDFLIKYETGKIPGLS